MLDAVEPVTLPARWRLARVPPADLHRPITDYGDALARLDGLRAYRPPEQGHLEPPWHEAATIDRYTAAEAVAHHAAIMDLPPRQIVALLMLLEAEVPGWPDADDVASIVQAAVAEAVP